MINRLKSLGKFLPVIPVALAVAALLSALVACSSPDESQPGGVESSGEHREAVVKAESAESEAGEESAQQYALTDTYDRVRAGARLTIAYDPASNAFTGVVANTTNITLNRVRVEVHLSNGVELGPTTPVDLAPGRSVPVSLPATEQPFATWSAHPEVGGGSDTSGEHTGGESSGEHSGSGSGEHRGG